MSEKYAEIPKCFRYLRTKFKKDLKIFTVQSNNYYSSEQSYLYACSADSFHSNLNFKNEKNTLHAFFVQANARKGSFLLIIVC